MGFFQDAIDAATGKILTEAIEALNKENYSGAKAAVSKLKMDSLSPYERSRTEQILASIYSAEDTVAFFAFVVTAILVGQLSSRLEMRVLLEEWSRRGFLGLGAQPPQPEWGAMLSEGRQYIQNAPHVAAFPGAAILVLVLGFNLFGDGLRDVLDPSLRSV